MNHKTNGILFLIAGALFNLVGNTVPNGSVIAVLWYAIAAGCCFSATMEFCKKNES